MITLASLRSVRWTAWPELVDDFTGIRIQLKLNVLEPCAFGECEQVSFIEV